MASEAAVWRACARFRLEVADPDRADRRGECVGAGLGEEEPGERYRALTVLGASTRRPNAPLCSRGRCLARRTPSVRSACSTRGPCMCTPQTGCTGAFRWWTPCGRRAQWSDAYAPGSVLSGNPPQVRFRIRHDRLSDHLRPPSILHPADEPLKQETARRWFEQHVPLLTGPGLPLVSEHRHHRPHHLRPRASAPAPAESGSRTACSCVSLRMRTARAARLPGVPCFLHPNTLDPTIRLWSRAWSPRRE
jgi:hypothetical protein